MSKAFTKESDDDDEPEKQEIASLAKKNYVTPNGLEALQTEYKNLLFSERPQIVESVHWAAKNGDRSENGDYIYGKRRLREIDRRVRYLVKRIQSAIVVDPRLQKDLTKVFFGATVTFRKKTKKEVTVKIVGIDEADVQQDKISWISPLAKALLKSEVGDNIVLNTPKGKEKLVILKISYE